MKRNFSNNSESRSDMFCWPTFFVFNTNIFAVPGSSLFKSLISDSRLTNPSQRISSCNVNIWSTAIQLKVSSIVTFHNFKKIICCVQCPATLHPIYFWHPLQPVGLEMKWYFSKSVIFHIPTFSARFQNERKKILKSLPCCPFCLSK